MQSSKYLVKSVFYLFSVHTPHPPTDGVRSAVQIFPCVPFFMRVVRPYGWCD